MIDRCLFCKMGKNWVLGAIWKLSRYTSLFEGKDYSKNFKIDIHDLTIDPF